jgi:predicted secreted protein
MTTNPAFALQSVFSSSPKEPFMKKTILTFGLISGVISSVLMCATIPFLTDLNHGDKGLLVGYTAMVLSFLLVFFGIRSYRDNLAGGAITFGSAFTIGICITLISCAFYVITWEILYFNFLPHFMDSYFAAQIQKAQSSPGTPEAIQAKVAAIRQSQQSYQNPLVNSLYTFIEPFPVGLLITIVSAAVLRKKPKSQPASLPANA